MQESLYSTYMEELCAVTKTSDACSLLARAAQKCSGACFATTLLISVDGRTLVLIEPNQHANGLPVEIEIGNMEDPLCYCVQSAQSMFYMLQLGAVPKSINRLLERGQKMCRAVTLHPLIAPGKKVIGALVCFFEEDSKPDDKMEPLLLYGSAIIAGFQERTHFDQMMRGYETDLSRAGSKAVAERMPSDEILGISDAMQGIKKIVMKAAAADVPILITGETGTGKSLIANIIHKYSNRCNGPFTEINCGAISENLLESELFGHRKGSFSGATSDYPGLFRSAEGGTVFLDEIGEMPVHLQSVLLHVLQEHKVRPVGSTEVFPINVRIIAATNIDLEKAMQEGLFRRDLFHRIAVVAIDIPPLAERKEDIVPLSKMFFEHFCKKHHKNGLKMSQLFIDFLLSHDYEGNVRELSYLIERTVMLSEDMDIDNSLEGITSNVHMPSLNLDEYIKEKEKNFIESCFLMCNNDLNMCASVLGIHPRTLQRRFRKYGLNG